MGIGHVVTIVLRAGTILLASRPRGWKWLPLQGDRDCRESKPSVDSYRQSILQGPQRVCILCFSEASELVTMYVTAPC